MRRMKASGLAFLGLALAITLGCSGEKGENGGGDGNGNASSAGESVKLQGAGASFPAPLYTKWFKDYSAAHDNVRIDYQSVGSGSGVKAVIDKTVDFGASDAAMKPEEIESVDVGVQLLPMTAGSIVLAYNLEGVKGLKLTRDAYVGIFLGEVKQWNDPRIADANPGLTLPDSPVNVVTRSDSSGTTYVFTKHLSTVSPEFETAVGTNKMPNWPVGTGAKGNEGVTGALKTTPGSIGYVEYGYAANLGVEMASLENKAGKFIEPNITSAQSSLAAVELPEDLIAWLPDPEGDDSYPIVTYTWMIFYKKYADPAKAKALKDVVIYCLDEGQKSSEQLGYIPLPANVVEKNKAALDNIQ